MIKIKSIIEKNEEISRLRQENFNVFSILRKEHEEEHLHSAFLAELLNCNGSHEMGSVFLKLFIDKFCKDKDKFHLKPIPKTHKEKKFENGKADIYIENANFVILIENKIWAEDGPEQLFRYHYHLNETKKQIVLFYLTLRGDEASKESTDNKITSNEDYFCLSYRNDIIGWLQDCMKEATNAPTVRETIKQYINLIKKLTGQLINQEMEKEMIEQIIKNYKVAKDIRDNFYKAKLQVVHSFLDKIKEKVIQELPEDKGWIMSKSKDLNNRYQGMSLHYKKSQYSIKIEGQLHNIINGESAFGLVAHEDHYDRKQIKDLLENELRNEYGCETSNWPFFHKKYNFGIPEQEERIFCDTENFAKEIADEFIKLARICQDKLKDSKTQILLVK